MTIHEMRISSQVISKIKKYCEKNLPIDERNPHKSEEFYGGDDKEIIGLLGEYVLLQYWEDDFDEFLKKRPINKGDGGVDVVINNFTCDIKTLKNDFIPNMKCNCNVTKRQHIKSKVDYYIFVTISGTYTLGYINGYLSRAEFDEIKVLHEKGEKESNDFVYPCPTYTVCIAELYNINELLHPIIKTEPKTVADWM